ncbi:transcriptional regulator swi6 [Coemansia sp. Benny D115]|nr:transcriptional regulator swi6 [Coemansia sp. Benny D115]
MESPDASAAVYAAVYSGIPVYEMICRGIAVMRRHSDSWLNATQILKVAGVEKGRRTKILEREVLTGEHEKIQGGYGKYQGTWVPFARGVELCNQYNVYSHIRPILEHDPTAKGTRPDKTPTKAEIKKKMRVVQKEAKRRERNDQGDGIAKKYRISSSTATSPLHSDMLGGYVGGALGVVPGTPGYMSGEIYNSKAMSLATPLRQSMYSSPAVNSTGGGASGTWAYHSATEETPLAVILDAEAEERANNAGKSPLHSDSHIKHDRTLLMNIFTVDDLSHIPEWLENGSPSVDLNLRIDEQGHTAVHWAAALARINVLDVLLYQGADARYLNLEGESALVRAVQVTNNFENQTFPDLLELLHDTIPLTDKSNRTVLHHIAIAAGIEGREKAARYYGECLLSWIVRLAGGYQVDGDDADEVPLIGDSHHAGSGEPGASNGVGHTDSATPNGNIHSGISYGNGNGVAKAPGQLINGLGNHLPTPVQSSSPNSKRSISSKAAFDDTCLHSKIAPIIDTNGNQQAPDSSSGAVSSSSSLEAVATESGNQGGVANGSNADFAAFLNLQDVNGNTALNLAARSGDRAMVRMLLNAGASATIANRVGLCPLDFGVDRIADIAFTADGDVHAGTADERLDIANSPTANRARLMNERGVFSARDVQMGHGAIGLSLPDGMWPTSSIERRMHQSVTAIQRLMMELESDFTGEMRLKNDHFEGIKQQLRDTTIELAKARETIHQLHTKTTQLSEIKSRVNYLEETLARETCAVREAIGALPADSKPRHDLEALLDLLFSSPSIEALDVDNELPAIPSISLADYSEDKLDDDPEKMQMAVERLRVINQVYARRDTLLRERVSALRRRADVSERERQYRQIIASCCEISEDDVDLWIDRLVTAVESTDTVRPDKEAESDAEGEPLLYATKENGTSQNSVDGTDELSINGFGGGSAQVASQAHPVS